jgi:integrase
MPYHAIPAFLASLRDRPAIAAIALEFLILTAARSGEVLGARWAEIDLAGKVWAVPAARMKAGRAHRVPLSWAKSAWLRSWSGRAFRSPRTNLDFILIGAPDGRRQSSRRVLSLEFIFR